MITEGLHGSADLLVGPQDTALALGSGDAEVLGTPRVLALAEEATVAATAGELDEGATTVGTEVALSHLAASAV
ncbi:thioesterase family protein, partial [Streptomonospora algeriensis]